MFNIPNILSMFRILIIPLFCYNFLLAETSRDLMISALILAISGLSDLVDGIVARKFNMITQLGKILDPVADKLTLFAVCVCLCIKAPELWLFYIFFIVKEIMMMLGSLFLMKKKVKLDGARWFGKIYTVLFYIIMLAIILLPNLNSNIKFALLLILAVFTVISFVSYIPVFFSLKSEIKK